MVPAASKPQALFSACQEAGQSTKKDLKQAFRVELVRGKTLLSRDSEVTYKVLSLVSLQRFDT
jgi:hypothetical protein